MKRMLFFTAFLIVASGCVKTDTSATKLDNGSRVFKDDSDTIPGVVYIGGCTSTAVSDSTLITAAHCVAGGKQVCIAGSMTSDQGKGACSNNVTVPNNYVAATQDPEPDFAVVIFPANTFKYYFPLSLNKLNREDPVLLVGYSRLVNLNQPNPENDDNKGTKRWGRNLIRSNQRGYSTVLDGTSNGVGLSQGDSGGPMFNYNCELVGAASTRGSNQSNHSNSSANINFFKTLETKGAYFCGVTGNDSVHCGANLAGPSQNSGKTADGRPIFPCSANGGANSGGGNQNNGNPDPGVNNGGVSDAEIKIKLHDLTLADDPLALFSVAKSANSIELCVTSSVDSCSNANATYKKSTSKFALGSRTVISMKLDHKKDEGKKDFVVIARDSQNTVIASRTFSLSPN